MANEDYIHPGRYADEHGSEITVTRQTSDGRYEVDYGSGVRSTLLGQTIRQVYGVAAVAVAALLLVPALALAAPAKHAQLAAAAAQVKVAEQQLYQTGSIPAGTALRVACKGTRKRIVCTASAVATFGSYKYTETFTVAHGKLSSANGLVPAVPANSVRARAAALTPIQVAAQVTPALRAQLDQRLKAMSFELGRHVALGAVSLRCVATPGAKSPWICGARYTVRAAGASLTYAETLDVWPGVRWQSATSPTLVGG